jgi:type II secretory pathway pseudopilin PulG
LVELVVAVSILVLLMSMLLPSLSNAWLLAKRASCQNCMKAIGAAACFYQTDNNQFVPMFYENLIPKSGVVNVYKSWRTNLLPYGPFGMFNCPCANDSGTIGGTFHSDAEVTGQGMSQTANAGSIGVMWVDALPSFQTPNFAGVMDKGNPSLSCAFSTSPMVAWADPPNSVYVADACLTKGPLTYPSRSYKDYGTSTIYQPLNTDPNTSYSTTGVSRRFSERHLGTNCLFLGGYVRSYNTQTLDAMKPGDSDCVWDTK